MLERARDRRCGWAREADADLLADFDEVIVATGVRPRDPEIPGQDGAERRWAMSTSLRGGARRAAASRSIGAGGIGFDVAEFLVHGGESPTEDLPAWLREWGVTDPAERARRPGARRAAPDAAGAAGHAVAAQGREARQAVSARPPAGFTAPALQMKACRRWSAASTTSGSTPTGCTSRFGEARERPTLIAADTIVLCAGQEPERALADALIARGRAVHVIGGADVAAELDAKRAIDQGTRLAASL